MTLQRKLHFGAGLLAAAGLAVSAAGLCQQRQQGIDLDTATARTASKLDPVNPGRAGLWEAVASLRGISLFAHIHDGGMVRASASPLEKSLARLRQQTQQPRPSRVTAEGRRRLEIVDEAAAEPRASSGEPVRPCQEGRAGQPGRRPAPRVRAVMGRAEPALLPLPDQRREILAESCQRAA